MTILLSILDLTFKDPIESDERDENEVEDKEVNEATESDYQNWYISRKLTPEQTNAILYHCRDMVTGSKPVSETGWKAANADKHSLSWKDEVYETVKSMKRKYKRENDKGEFEKAVDICRKKICYS